MGKHIGPRFTKKEREIFELNMQGMTKKEMCEVLGMTEHTLKSHFVNMANKLAMPDFMNFQYFFACEWIKVNLIKKRCNQGIFRVTPKKEPGGEEKKEQIQINEESKTEGK